MGQAGNWRTCAHCGTLNAPSEQFCVNCGYALTSGPNSQGQGTSPPVAVTNNPGRRVTGALVPGVLLGGRYRIVQVLGKGGFGAVYKAVDTRFQGQRVVAIKEMSDAQLSQSEKVKALEDFRHEANLLVQLNHPNLPNVSDFFEEVGKAYLVMGWALQLCTVLHYLHTRPHPIIFREMKPSKEVPADAPTRRVNPQAFITPRQLNRAISPATEAIVLKAMEENPQDRYQSAAQMAQTIVTSGVVQPNSPGLPTSGPLLGWPISQSLGAYPTTPSGLSPAAPGPSIQCTSHSTNPVTLTMYYGSEK